MGVEQKSPRSARHRVGQARSGEGRKPTGTLSLRAPLQPHTNPTDHRETGGMGGNSREHERPGQESFLDRTAGQRFARYLTAVKGSGVQIPSAPQHEAPAQEGVFWLVWGFQPVVAWSFLVWFVRGNLIPASDSTAWSFLPPNSPFIYLSRRRRYGAGRVTSGRSTSKE